MNLIELIQGWAAANTHGDEQNTDLVPWGERRAVWGRVGYINHHRMGFIENHGLGFFDSVRWFLCRLCEYAELGGIYETMIEVLQTGRVSDGRG